jgi:hypothetical protein
MVPLAALLSAVLVETAPVELARKFTAGETLNYTVRASMQAQSRAQGLLTPIPEDLDLQYDFSVRVLRLKADGIAEVIYARPTFTTIEGETFDAPPKRTVERINQRVNLTLSPTNDILDNRVVTGRMLSRAAVRRESVDLLDEFIGEMQRLALFVGPFDSALDIAPRFPLEPVSPGDTWQRTVGYQPQKMRGSDKQAVQRLDYTYTYRGPVTVNNKPFVRVEAVLKLDTDLAAFVRQIVSNPEALDDIAKIPLKLDAKILFNLDPKTLHTVRAEATSEGLFGIYEKDDPEDPLLEERLKGRTVLQLQAAPAKR